MAAIGLLLILIVLLSFMDRCVVFAYYCEWNECKGEQYCCGDNLCCDYVHSLWYIWIGVIFAILLLSACGGIFRYCIYSPPQLINYTSVPVIISPDDNVILKIRDDSQSGYISTGNSRLGDMVSVGQFPSPSKGHLEKQKSLYSNYL